MSKLNKLANHFKNNTLKDRIRYQFSGLKKWEDMKAGKRKFVMHKISKESKIKLYPNSYLSYLILKGDFEKQELNFIHTLLQKDDYFLDIGANIGIFSVLASEKCKNVFSFEPTPQTFDRLKENMELNHFPSTKLFRLALSTEKGDTEFNISEDGMDAWNNISSSEDNPGFVKVKVQTETLDNLGNELNLPENAKVIIKMDVEGWELNVMKGAQNFFEKYSPLMMIEFNDENFLRNDYCGKDLVLYLKSLGFDFYEMENGRLKSHEIRSTYEYINLIASKGDTLLKSRKLL